jgi:hypothetical protein
MSEFKSINITKSLILLFIVVVLSFPLCKGQDVENIELTDNIVDKRNVITELYVGGKDQMVVHDRALILTGNVTVMNASELMITSSNIRLSIRGERGYNISISDKGNMIISNSSIYTLSNASLVRLLDNGQLKVLNSNLTDFKSLSTSGNSTLIVQGSRLNIDNIICTGSNTSFTESMMPIGDLNATAEHVELENFKGDNIFLDVNNSLLNHIKCDQLEIRSVESVHLNHSEVEHCEIESQNETFVKDSSFKSLAFNSSGTAINVSTSEIGERAGGAIRVAENSSTIVKRYWYLAVNVTEMTGLGIPAKIIVEDYFGNTILEDKSDVYGLYEKPILAEIINSTKTIFVGNYKVKAQYGNITTSYSPIVLDKNIALDLQFKSPIPLESSTKLMVPSDSVMINEPVKIEGWIVKELPAEDIEIVANGPGNASITFICKTDENGIFEKEFTPYAEGQWTVYADWIGGSAYGERFTKSQPFKLTVQPRPSLIILLIQALPIAVVVVGVFTTITFLALGSSKSKVQ